MAKVNVEKLNDRLRIARVAMIPELLQREVGKMVGRSAPCVGMWESGKSEPRLSDLIKLASIYNVSTDWLLGQDTEKSRATDRKLFAGNNEGDEATNSVPLLHSVDIVKWNTDGLNPRVQTTLTWAAGQAVAWTVDTDAISSVCGVDDVAIIERETTAVHSGIYLVLVAGSTSPTLRRCLRDMGKLFFSADKDGFQTYRELDITVIGRLREAIKRTVI